VCAFVGLQCNNNDSSSNSCTAVNEGATTVSTTHNNICAPVWDPNTTRHTRVHCTYQENVNVRTTQIFYRGNMTAQTRKRTEHWHIPHFSLPPSLPPPLSLSLSHTHTKIISWKSLINIKDGVINPTEVKYKIISAHLNQIHWLVNRFKKSQTDNWNAAKGFKYKY